MALNSLYQFADDVHRIPDVVRLPQARWLNIADYLLYQLSGEARAEESLASTTQLYDPRKRFWSMDLVDAIGLPRNTLPSIVPSGSILGSVTAETAEVTGLRDTRVVASCSHDTAAAIAAVPAEEAEDWAYLSSGTWSLLGLELPGPLMSEQARLANYTNEVGYGGTTRFLKNIVGLWILQEVKRDLDARGQGLDYAALNEAASAAEPTKCLIHPADPRFLRPGEMIQKIQDFCASAGQPIPTTPGELTRCVLDSLALYYAQVVDELENLSHRSIRRIHIVGGGSRSDLLNRATAEATGRVVLAGPSEATALGNILVQALALGQFASLPECRSLVRRSFQPVSYEPRGGALWSNARQRFAALRIQ
jgi:rhamnulokinase